MICKIAKSLDLKCTCTVKWWKNVSQLQRKFEGCIRLIDTFQVQKFRSQLIIGIAKQGSEMSLFLRILCWRRYTEKEQKIACRCRSLQVLREKELISLNKHDYNQVPITKYLSYYKVINCIFFNRWGGALCAYVNKALLLINLCKDKMWILLWVYFYMYTNLTISVTFPFSFCFSFWSTIGDINGSIIQEYIFERN